MISHRLQAGTLLLGLGVGMAFVAAATFLVLSLLFLRSPLPVAAGPQVTRPDGIPALGLRLPQALPVLDPAARLAADLDRQFGTQTILVQAAGSSWTITPAQLGMQLDAQGAARAARANDITAATAGGLLAALPPAERATLLRYDPVIAEAALRSMATRVDAKPADARVLISSGQVQESAPVRGRQLDVPATLALISQDPVAVIAAGQLPLVMRDLPPAVSNVSALAAQARQLLAAPLAVYLYDPISDQRWTWTVAPGTLGEWLAPDAGAASWQVAPGKLQAYLSSQSAGLGDGRSVRPEEALRAITQSVAAGRHEVRLRVYHAGREHTVQPGETLASIAARYGMPYPWIQQANPGAGDMLHAGQRLAIPSADVLLPLPPVENKRVIISLSQQRLWAYENGSAKWEWRVSTGIASSPTAAGVYQVQTHVADAYAANWNLNMPYFMGIYQPVPGADFMNGFHGFPRRGNAQLLWTGDLGRPVTYGCILLDTANAKTLYEWANEGTVVEIRP